MTTPHRGLLISFDGVDSSGKETQAQRLCTRLRSTGLTVQHFATPDYETPSGQELKRLLQDQTKTWAQLPWEQKMRLFANNRQEHQAEVLHALQHEEIVVYDRYVASSLAFITTEALTPQTVDLYRAQVQQTIARYEYETNGMPVEDMTIFLDVPPAVSSALLKHRKMSQSQDDEYTDHIEVQNRLYNEYDILCQSNPDRYVRIPCVVNGQLLGIDDISELIWEAVRTKFPFLAKPHANS